ncbi:MAG: hypothetical protein ACYCUM_01905 [Solirubrobacteraceae bacterium]
MRVAAVAAVMAAVLAAVLALAAEASAARPTALHASDTARLHYVQAVGEQVYETGSASGELPGSMHVYMVFASTFTGRFTIYTRYGTISGRGRAKTHGGGIWESFAGTLVVTAGSRRYRGAHGAAHLYGTFNRETYALTIKTTGTLRY